jgi:glycosyltransferase involved in cell wall biosynthesis
MKLKPINEIAFVTAYLDIYRDDNIVEKSRNRGVEWRLKTFQPLADTGIPIYLFYSKKYAEIFETEEYQTRNPNVIPFKIIELEDTWTWKIAQQHQPLSMPEQRDEKKDTYQYMILQNAKQEFIQQVMERFPIHNHYAWIDFSIVHMFKHPQKSLEYLRVCYGPREIPRNKPDEQTPQFFMPGCWGQRWFEPDLDSVMKRIHWRFCGSFFIASAHSMQNFIRLYRHCFPLFLKEHRQMIWEVNFWAWLEVTNQILLEKFPTTPEIKPWKPTWYSSDHNDTIFRAPYWPFAAQSLINYVDTRVELLKLADNLPPEKRQQDDQEWIGSSSFVHSSIHGPLLNTRVMNYWLYPNGYYRFIDPKHILRTRNLLSKLDEHGQPLQTFAIEEDFDQSILKHHKPDTFSQGLEDIRLWRKPSSADTTEESLRFIATNINYTPNGRGRMMTGQLHISLDENTQEIIPIYRNAIGIEPPTDTYTEKNWIPLILPETSDTEDHFIYQWSPFQLGNIQCPSLPKTDEKGGESEEDAPRAQLKIHTTLESHNPFLFERMRGSSPFVPFPDKLALEEWLGVVHFSDEDHPRKYSHLLISLDKQGKPVRYSAPFTFCKIGVEFCVGFHTFEQENETLLRFWISRHDRDTTIVTTQFRHIPLEYSYPSTHLPQIILEPPQPEAPPKTSINIFILCYNEELVIPHTLRHYRTHFPNANITIYDNESTDRSREIAEEWGCRVISWSSGNIQNEYIQQNIKNDAWKTETAFIEEVKIDPRPEWSGPGWKIVVDMDEWLEITEADLAYEEAEGNTILRIKGVNVMGQSQHPLLEDVSPEAFHQWNLVADWDAENKNLCFLTPQISKMNYTRGAHGCKPEGERVQYSKRIYYNKHMENLGLPFFIRKFTLRAKRNEIMQTRNINLHYTDDIAKLTERYTSLFENAYVLETFAPITDENYPLFVGHYYT